MEKFCFPVLENRLTFLQDNAILCKITKQHIMPSCGCDLALGSVKLAGLLLCGGVSLSSVTREMNVYEDGKIKRKAVSFSKDGIGVSNSADAASQLQHCYLFPGFADVHVHLREPGFSYKETIASGTMAAVHGGYTDVCAMPNLSPVPDCLAHLQPQLERIAKTAHCRVHPYGAITRDERGDVLADFSALAPHVVAFSDDGRGVQSREMMLQAMYAAKAQNKIIAAHCEDNSLLHGGYIHAGAYAQQHGHKGICAESEWGPIARDLELAAQTGCSYHVCHISCAQSVALIREAKRSGIDVTCETAPHYLVLDDHMLQEDGRFKMNPPLRSPEDRAALLEGIQDGTIDMIATDHAPHAASEKSNGLAGSLNGIVGLETAFSVLYTALVRTGFLPLERLIALLSDQPRQRFGLAQSAQNYTIFDLSKTWTVEPEAFYSMGRSTPFAGNTLYGQCLCTVVDGKTAWCAKEWQEQSDYNAEEEAQR